MTGKVEKRDNDRQFIREIRRLEWFSFFSSLVLLSVCFLFQSSHVFEGVVFFVVFVQVNIRLLIWSWESVVWRSVGRDISYWVVAIRFFTKFSFFVVGAWTVLGHPSIQKDQTLFLFGFFGFFAATLLSPYMLVRSESHK